MSQQAGLLVAYLWTVEVTLLFVVVLTYSALEGERIFDGFESFFVSTWGSKATLNIELS